MFFAQNVSVANEVFGYGYLYNGYIVKDYPTILMTGLRVPTKTDIDLLGSYIGNGGTLKEAGTNHWDTPNAGATNIYNFNAYGGGTRDRNSSIYTGLKRNGLWGTSTPVNVNTIYSFSLIYSSANLFITQYDNPNTYHVRCMRDLTPAEQSANGDGDIVAVVSDYDGNKYNLIKIGTQGWMSSNLKTTTYTTGVAIVYNPSSGMYFSPAMWAYNDDLKYV